MSQVLRPIVALGALASRIVASLLLVGIAVYQAVVSPLLHALTGAGCRFSPSCSAYAAESIRLNGPLRGSGQAVRRLLRCHPFHPGGHDPPVRLPSGTSGR